MSMDTLTERAGKPAARTPMTPARRLILAVGVPVLVALIGWTGLSVVAEVGTGTYQFSRALPVTNGTLTANLGDADVTLVPVPGNSARLTGTITYSLIRPDVTIQDSSVSYHCAVPAGQCSLNSTLSVPRTADVNLSSGTGDLTVNGGLSGKITLSTSTGDLTANVLADSPATLRTVAGDITASGISASDVTVSSVTGDVTLTFTDVPSNVTVRSTTGDITIILPSGPSKYRIVPSDGVGDVSDSAVPQDPTSPHVITVSSTTGDISITTS
jgi:hypothetical protein